MRPRSDLVPPAATPAAVAVDPQDVDAVLAGTQTVAGLIAESTAQVHQHVTMAQLRVLVLASDEGPLSLSTVAGDLGVHPSNATRTCDRLVEAGLLDRQHAQDDRRRVVLTLTPAGKRLVHKVMAHRRRLVERLLASMDPADRVALAGSLRALAAAQQTR